MIVHVNLLSGKANINNEPQKTLSSSNVRQASRKPRSRLRDVSHNLNNFSRNFNYSV
jgi:hypothetical protein